MGKKSTGAAPHVHGSNDLKTDVKLVLQPEKYTKINIFLLTLIVLLVLGTELMSRSEQTQVLSQKDILKQQIQKSKRNLQQVQKQCPMVLEDHETCQQKLQQCYQTDKQFKQANQQMTGAITQCEAVNIENAQLNEKISSEIIKMDETLKTLE